MHQDTSLIPPLIRVDYPPAQRAVLAAIAGEIMAAGQRDECQLAPAAIALRAGVSRPTVETTFREARRRGHLATVAGAVQRGRHRPPVIIRLSETWSAWLAQRQPE
jgi:hypothetical protein